jgi:hypothetical protein
MTPSVSRSVRAGSLVLVLGLGLASRSKSMPWPPFFAAYAGETLWALLVLLLLPLPGARAAAAPSPAGWCWARGSCGTTSSATR